MQSTASRAIVRVPFSRRRQLELKAKRAFDFSAALFLLILLLPFFALMAILIRIDSPGPAIFRQRRLGQGGTEFDMLKFRSMQIDADAAVHRQAVARLARGEPAAFVDGRPVFKAASDPRVTRIGRLIRSTNLDELPQLWNVLRGEMSLVGPRPAIPYELDLYDEQHFRRFAVPQGITGLWQVRRESTRSFADVLNLDLEYVDHYSLLLDFRILILTLPRLFPRKWSF